MSEAGAGSPWTGAVVLDATLRDGGYLNDWRFSADHADHAVRVAARAGADVIEVGYLDDREGLPETAASPPGALERFRRYCGHSRLAAMMRPDCAGMDDALRRRREWLDLVRIPTSVSNPEPVIQAARRCRDQGIRVSVNLTNVSAFPVPVLAQTASKMNGCADFLYLADSRGALRPEQVRDMVSAVRLAWDGPLGFHPHDNLGLAYANSKAAVGAGCNWLDGTLCGVGMGGRNLSLESAFAIQGRTPLDSRALSDCRESDFSLDGPGADHELYRLGALRNLPMAWPGWLIERFGLENALARMAHVPGRNWFETGELEPWLGDDVATSRVVRRRVYRGEGVDHAEADEVFYQLVKPVHERHGAVFLGRERDADGRVVVEWLYASAGQMEEIQQRVARDPETLAHRNRRLESGLHGRPFEESVIPARDYFEETG